MENMKRQTDYNDKQVNVLKSQYKNLQQSFNFQEQDLTAKKQTMVNGDQIRMELKNTIDEMNKLRRNNLVEMDTEKERY